MEVLDQWVEDRWLKKHSPGAKEVQNLFDIVLRDFRDAKNSAATLSLDNQLVVLYNAALTLAEVALRVSGYRIGSGVPGHHEKVLKSIQHTLGAEWYGTYLFLDTIRRRRNQSEYDSMGIATPSDVTDIFSELERLIPRVRELAEENGYPVVLSRV